MVLSESFMTGPVLPAWKLWRVGLDSAELDLFSGLYTSSVDANKSIKRRSISSLIITS